MKSHLVKFPNASGEQLSGRIDLPEDETPRAWALFVHCFTCGKNLKSSALIARALTQEKIAVLRFDFTGLGESEGDFSASNFSSNVEDLVAAAQWLATEYQAPEILLGHSFGGAAVLQAAAQLPQVRAVATIAAPFDPEHVTHLFTESLDQIKLAGEAQVKLAGRQFFVDLSEQQVEQQIGRLKSALLVLHSPVDQAVGIENATKIYQAAKHPKSFISLDRADHLLNRDSDALYVGQMIANWACRYLEPMDIGGIETDVIDSRVTVRTGAQGFYTEMFANGHALPADEPIAYGGTNRGPTPYDYLLTSLGACTSMTVQMYARKKWPLQSAVVRLSHAKIHAEDCENCELTRGKLDHFSRELELVGDLSPKQRQKLLEISERCPVHKTLHAEVRVKTTLKR
ncbi:MAG: osmotically inducible protein C [Spirochaetes bacterium]|nr:MAG: osmotically inducible protein C [Spirochaetota bacterium]